MDIGRWGLGFDLRRWLTAAGWAYFSILFGWLAAFGLTRDRFAYVALANSLAVYLFYPLPLAAILAAWTRRRELWVGCGLAAVAFGWLWGGLFVPKAQPAAAGTPALTVMTYNVLGIQGDAEPMIQAIRREGPDVVAMQEVTLAMSRALQAELAAEYPYQIHQPEEGVAGLAVISKYPLRESGEILPLEWLGAPQVLALDWDGQAVTVVNFHMWPPGLGRPENVSAVNRRREAQAQALADFARQAAGPLVALGDGNATELSEMHRIVTSALADAWLEAGFGLGHTFPGAVNDFSSRPAIGPVAVPQWLVRIDYVFHSEHFRAEAARTAQFDGVSDHRGVVARLRLEN